MNSWLVRRSMLRNQVGPRLLKYSTQVQRQLPFSLSDTAAGRQSIESNKLLGRLSSKLKTGEFKLSKHDESGDGPLNSDRSLPMTVFPKQRIFNEVSEDDKIGSWRKGIMKWIRLGVFMLKYYRSGLQNTYHVAKSTRNLLASRDLDPKFPLATQMSKAIEFGEIRLRLKKEPSSLPLTRKEFVEYYRRDQVWKIPAFLLAVLALEEFTVVLCYFFPKIAPHNSLTPGAYFKISRSQANSNDIIDPSKYKSPYTLDRKALFQVLRTLPVMETPKWRLKLYELIDNKRQPCETLMHFHQYLFVDDCLLLKSILHGDDVQLSFRELVNCIWERQLYHKDEDINKMVNDDIGRQILIWRLFLYWSFRFDNTVTVGGDQLFAEKWGVNNVSILNYTGLEGCGLLEIEGLSTLEVMFK